MSSSEEAAQRGARQVAALTSAADGDSDVESDGSGSGASSSLCEMVDLCTEMAALSPQDRGDVDQSGSSDDGSMEIVDLCGNADGRDGDDDGVSVVDLCSP